MTRQYVFTRANQADRFTSDCPVHGSAPHYVSSRQCIACNYERSKKARRAQAQRREEQIEALMAEIQHWKERALRAELNAPPNTQPDLIGDLDG